MGQQQLLLLVIGIVLVGLAVVAGIEAVQKYTKQDEVDGLVERSLAIATHAFYWKTMQDPFAGGDMSYERLGTNGMAQLALDTTTVRGVFQITDAWPDSIEITAASSRYENIGVRVIVDQNNIRRTVVAFDGSITMP